MAHVILGLLLIAPQSYYDLIKGFESGVALFYSASSGSIKRALDALLAQERIEVASVEAGGRGRKVYRVTDAGSAEFRAWMTADLAKADLETAALSRLYFLGLLEPADRLPVLRRITARIETDLAVLSDLDKQLDALDLPAERRDLVTHQRATLDYGIASHRFMLDWFRDHIDRQEPPIR
ncbi:PadR family transcriptional regulator [Actinoalloteichus hymeniacidonis]|uniref:Transcriptional regulator n=1 Tax=Actinoalloteichus hymeniacidonis TaxID=340345 RepID=A0AAC9N101_9PSEU|nr:PadR family transcriptional regulator [Actinoalloteichus hymeniacidonis]AOS65386.1 putative transcriptional regulator [Actinoalloteichus hymeniacidonis]MBB5906528.1 DNA-binding PadR family transcriptional regulator [Actinoalloteichus hymeniacidonis]